MSGIVGIVNLDGKPCEESSIVAMLQAMEHRGSDREDFKIEQNIVFGHKALWNTPEAKEEKQPVCSQDGKFLLTADARIDNRQELFFLLDLEQVASERVVTDAELILKSYEKWGSRLAEYLLGDFAFALYDRHREELMLIRDHVGIRPLYYIKTDKLFCFASEITPLFKVPGVERCIDKEMEVKYLECRFLNVDETFFKGVKRLPAATILRLRENQISFKKYWFPEKIEIDRKISFAEAAERFRVLLEEAVRCRMRSITPVGCELSGGLDSSSVFALATDLAEAGTRLMPISMHFGKMDCDESYYSELIAKEKGYNLEVVHMDKLDYQEKYSLLSYYKKFQDWPRGMFFIGVLPIAERLESHHVCVVLTGQGGDHVCRGSGYFMADKFRAFRWFALVKELRRWPWTWSELKSHMIKPNLPEFVLVWLQKWKLVAMLSPCQTTPSIKKIPYRFAFTDELEDITGSMNQFLLDSSAYHDMEHYHIEARHPFFDKRLIEFSLSLPTEYKLGNGYTKRVLRASLSAMLPPEIRDRKDKAEFSKMLELQMEARDNMIYLDNIGSTVKAFFAEAYKEWKRICK